MDVESTYVSARALAASGVLNNTNSISPSVERVWLHLEGAGEATCRNEFDQGALLALKLRINDEAGGES